MRSGRTTKVSMAIPAAITRANSRNEPRHDREQGKARCERDPRHPDGPRRRGRGDRDCLAQTPAAGLGPDPPRHEDVVVRAERHEQHRGGEGDVVGELVAAQYELGEVHGQTERGREAQHTGGKEEQGRDQRAHESASRRKLPPAPRGRFERVRSPSGRSSRRPARSRRRSAPACLGRARPPRGVSASVPVASGGGRSLSIRADPRPIPPRTGRLSPSSSSRTAHADPGPPPAVRPRRPLPAGRTAAVPGGRAPRACHPAPAARAGSPWGKRCRARTPRRPLPRRALARCRVAAPG